MSDEERDLERKTRKAASEAEDAEDARSPGADRTRRREPEGPKTSRLAHDADCFMQARLGWSARCEIFDDHVVYEQARPLSRMATRVPFESIPDDPVREMRISRPWAWTTSAFFALMLLCLQPLSSPGGDIDPMSLVLASFGFVASALLLRHQSGHFVVYPCEGKSIEFVDRGEDEQLRAFLDHLQARKARYLSETYGPRASEPGSAFDVLEDPSDDPGGYRH